MIHFITRSLSSLQTLTCVELGQRPGNTSCTFEDSDIEGELSISFLKSFDMLMKNNKKLKRVNIFFPLHLAHLDMFANISMPTIFGTAEEPSHMLSFFGLNCDQIRQNNVSSNFM